MEFLTDTTLLIDLQRDLRGRRRTGAKDLLMRRGKDLLFVSVITVGEYLAGFPEDEHATAWEFLKQFRVLPLSAEIAEFYARLERKLRLSGLLLDANDLWIAATALAHQMPLITRNDGHFGRVSGLVIEAY